MNVAEYTDYYIDFVVTILGPSVKREAACDPKLEADPQRQSDYENLKTGLIILALVSFVESNFLTKPDLRALRNFLPPQTPLPPKVDPAQLACFVYIRDCFAHGPTGALLGAGANTSGFCAAVSGGTFSHATIQGPRISVAPGATISLHNTILRLFGKTV